MDPMKSSNEQNANNTKSTPSTSSKKQSKEKAHLIEEINQAVLELSLIKEGKKEARDVEDFLNKL